MADFSKSAHLHRVTEKLNFLEENSLKVLSQANLSIFQNTHQLVCLATAKNTYAI